MVESTNPGAVSSAANAASMQKFLHDRQVADLKYTAIVAAPGIAMAALRARQQSEARANEMLAQQQQMNHQLWIQNQLLSGRSMRDVQAQLDANESEQLAQQQANDEANQAKSAGMGRFLICIVLSVFLSTRVSGMSFWPATLIWLGIPIVLLIGWGMISSVITPAATKPTTDGSRAAAIEGTHEQWLSAFREEQVSKLKDRPANED